MSNLDKKNLNLAPLRTSNLRKNSSLSTLSTVSPNSATPRPQIPKIDHTKALFNAIRKTFTVGNNVTEDPHQVLTTVEISKYRDAFETFADEETETITLKAIDKIMRRMFQNPTEEELTEMIREVDENGDHEVDFDEFLILIMQNKRRALVPEDELNDEAFQLFDQNGEGFIRPKNLQHIFHSLMKEEKNFEPITIEECEFMIREVKQLNLMSDSNDPSELYLTKGEFVKLLRMKPGQEKTWAQGRGSMDY